MPAASSQKEIPTNQQSASAGTSRRSLPGPGLLLPLSAGLAGRAGCARLAVARRLPLLLNLPAAQPASSVPRSCSTAVPALAAGRRTSRPSPAPASAGVLPTEITSARLYAVSIRSVERALHNYFRYGLRCGSHDVCVCAFDILRLTSSPQASTRGPSPSSPSPWCPS